KGTRADPVRGARRLISQMRVADSDQNFRRGCLPIAGIGFAERRDSCNFGHGGTKVLRPHAHRGSTGCPRASDVDQYLSVVGVGKKLDLPYSLRNFARGSAPPQGGDTPVDQRRTDWTLLDGQQFVRSQFEVSRCKFGADLHLQARTVAIIPRRRRMDLDVEG